MKWLICLAFLVQIIFLECLRKYIIFLPHNILKEEYWANQIFWGFVTWGFKPGDKLGGLNNNKITLEITVDNN